MGLLSDEIHVMRADRTKVMITTARLPLHRDQANNQLGRPSAHGLIWFMTELWSRAQPHASAPPGRFLSSKLLGNVPPRYMLRTDPP